MAIINGQAIAEKINRETAEKVQELKQKGVVPKLAVVLVGDDPASLTYIRQKEKVARQTGVDFALYEFGADIAKKELIKRLKEIQKDKAVSGLIIQLPIPEKLYCPEVLNAIKPERDVDFLSEPSLGKILMGTNENEPPTPGSILTILRDLKVNLEGKDITIVGMGTLVGKPLSMLLEHAGASITTCNNRTKDIPGKCRRADIIISCVGKKDLIRGDMVKDGAIVIDAGFSFFEGKSYGDVNFAEVSEKASYVTPTPGGVGPITVALLISNVVKLAKRK
jgi:methylenetetrahydrofolate dehydrogenase (NADP+)/methenyltetrahydrofolate cyclohydrolase